MASVMMQKASSLLFRKKEYSDKEIIQGLQKRDRKTEDAFFNDGKRYFDEHFREVFFDQDKKQEIFQTAFLKIWTEISNGKISIKDETICRQQRNGEYTPMTCRLTTFLMTFAKTEYREMVRSDKLDVYADVYENVNSRDITTTMYSSEDDIEEQKVRIVDDCISALSPHCTEIITLFYYKGMSLDEIIDARREKSSSKNGLKTAKNKCMNSLREKIVHEYKRHGFGVS